MWREKNIYFTEHDIYFTKLMFILKNINLELKSALRTKYIFYRILLYFIHLRVLAGVVVVGLHSVMITAVLLCTCRIQLVDEPITLRILDY